MNKKSDKLLTIAVPAFQAKKWFIKNIKFWLALSQLAHVIIIEDQIEPTLNQLFQDTKIKVFNKPNGNWGSVLNYLKHQKLIKTKYFAIFDADDTANIDEIKKVILALKKFNADLVYTNYNKINFKTQKSKKTKVKWQHPFVHSMWIKTNIFYKMPNLPENVYFMDILFVFAIRLLAKTFLYLKQVYPYNYFFNIVGQSTNIKNIKEYNAKLNSLTTVDNIKTWLNLHNLPSSGHARNYISKAKQKINLNKESTRIYWLRQIYESTTDKAQRKIAFQTYKNIKIHSQVDFDVHNWFIWSILYRFFKI